MIVEEVSAQLETALNPIIKVLKKGEGFKVIVIGFKKEAILKEHQTPINAKLLVIKGSVTYKEADREIKLKQFQDLEIPVNVKHSLQADENSICLLIQG